MKKYIILLLIVSFVFICFGSLLLINNHLKEKKREKSTTDLIISTDDAYYPSTTFSDLFITLSEYGDKVYQSKEYKKYPKRNNIYFISLRQLRDDYGYDISIFKDDSGKICNIDDSGVYFDTENALKLDIRNAYYPLAAVLTGCEENVEQ